MGCRGRAIVLGELSMPGRPTNLNNSRARASVFAVGAGGHCLDYLLSPARSLFGLPPSGRRLDKTEIMSPRAINLRQLTKQSRPEVINFFHAQLN